MNQSSPDQAAYNAGFATTFRRMRIYLQTQPQAGEAPHYVQLMLQQDLLGGWTLFRESGIEGGKATLRKQVFLDREQAQQALETTRDRQLQRGYRVMITEGF